MKLSLFETIGIWSLFSISSAFSHVTPDNESSPEASSGANVRTPVTIVLISDRVDGILPTLGSLVAASSIETNLEVIMIGDAEVNLQVQKHFEGSIKTFRHLTMKDVESDLFSRGITPIWRWEEFGSSHDPNWRNEHTIRLANWDGLQTHENPFNLARFYLPHLSALEHIDNFFLIDDDLIVQGDVGSIVQAASNIITDDSKGLVCPCNVWIWDGECSKYEFKNQEETILNSPPLYGTSPMCDWKLSDAEDVDCVPDSFFDFLEAMVPPAADGSLFDNQLAWNFGFCFVSKTNWLKLKLTERYETTMKASYKDHVFPENSLAFGLGASYLAFAGSMACWDDDDVTVRDGFGFLPPQAYQEAFGSEYVDVIDVIHYTGPAKPWEANTNIPRENLLPWFASMQREGMEVPSQLDEFRDIQLLIYETTPFSTEESSRSFQYLQDAGNTEGVNATVFGRNIPFHGFGSKYSAVKPYLEKMHPEELVVISDGRDVLINVNGASKGSSGAIVSEFKRMFLKLTEQNPNSVVVSTEAQCCVSALTHIRPGDLFGSDGIRVGYTCDSSNGDCHWAGDEFAAPWESFMENLAKQRGFVDVWDVYLNAGLIAGKAKNLLDLIISMNIQESEDDQAVLTDFLFRRSHAIILDYEQRLFGSNRWADDMENRGCMFELDGLDSNLAHLETRSKPLFIHSNGGFLECQDHLNRLLEKNASQWSEMNTELTTGRRLKSKTTSAPNYKSTKAPKARRLMPSVTGEASTVESKEVSN